MKKLLITIAAIITLLSILISGNAIVAHTSVHTSVHTSAHVTPRVSRLSSSFHSTSINRSTPQSYSSE